MAPPALDSPLPSLAIATLVLSIHTHTNLDKIAVGVAGDDLELYPSVHVELGVHALEPAVGREGAPDAPDHRQRWRPRRGASLPTTNVCVCVCVCVRVKVNIIVVIHQS